MAATTKNCPKCGGPLTAASGDATKLACKSCGLSFGVRPKKAVAASAPAGGARAPRNEFADFTDATDAPPRASSDSRTPPRPASGGDPRLRMALLVGAGLAFVFLVMLGTVVVAVVLWARSAAPAAAVAAASVNTPTVPAAADPTPPPAPPKRDPTPVPPPKSPTPPPMTDPAPMPPTPPVIPPVVDPAAPPDLKPAVDPTPMADPTPMPMPMPMPAPMPAGGPINQAIDKAVAFLKVEATGGAGVRPGPGPGPGGLGGFRGGNQVGVMGLMGLALLESGVPADDPAVVATTTAVRGGAPTCSNTYEMAIAVWCLDRLGDPKDEDLIRDLAARLIAGQLESGRWTYNCPQGGAGAGAVPGAPGLPFGPKGGPLGLNFGMPGTDLTSDQIKELMETLAKYEPGAAIPAKQQLAPVCHFVRGKKVDASQQAGAMLAFGGGDLSLTQFAVLGLWVARRHHMPVDRSLLLAEAGIRAGQSADGGWAYSGTAGMGVLAGMGTTDSMTCSGMMELAIGRGVGHSENAKTVAADPQFEKGLIYLADLFSRGVPGRPKDAKADPKEVQNLTAAVGKLQPLLFPLFANALPAQAAGWKKELTVFQAELEKQLALDLPPEAKKDLQAIEDQIKEYQAAPAEKKKKEKEDLEKLLQQSTVLQAPAGVGAFAGIGFMGARPGRFLKPGKTNRMNMDDIYCLWSLERLCMVCDLKTVAGHDWYAWGADLLVSCQNEDGSWTGSLQSPVDACLALLFLKRVNVAQDLTTQLRLIAPIKDLSADKLKFISSGESPSSGLTQPKSPGETQPSPGEAPPVKAPGDAPPAAPPDAPKP